MKRVVVTGLGIVSPIGNNAAEVTKSLKDGTSGIEFVQEGESGKDGHWMDRQILARPAQANAGLRLVRYLQARFGIKKRDVVGHATANDSPYFKEYTGIRNAAGDWFSPEVRAFRARL